MDQILATKSDSFTDRIAPEIDRHLGIVRTEMLAPGTEPAVEDSAFSKTLKAATKSFNVAPSARPGEASQSSSHAAPGSLRPTSQQSPQTNAKMSDKKELDSVVKKQQSESSVKLPKGSCSKSSRNTVLPLETSGTTKAASVINAKEAPKAIKGSENVGSDNRNKAGQDKTTGKQKEVDKKSGKDNETIKTNIGTVKGDKNPKSVDRLDVDSKQKKGEEKSSDNLGNEMQCGDEKLLSSRTAAKMEARKKNQGKKCLLKSDEGLVREDSTSGKNSEAGMKLLGTGVADCDKAISGSSDAACSKGHTGLMASTSDAEAITQEDVALGQKTGKSVEDRSLTNAEKRTRESNLSLTNAAKLPSEKAKKDGQKELGACGSSKDRFSDEKDVEKSSTVNQGEKVADFNVTVSDTVKDYTVQDGSSLRRDSCETKNFSSSARSEDALKDKQKVPKDIVGKDGMLSEDDKSSSGQESIETSKDNRKDLGGPSKAQAVSSEAASRQDSASGTDVDDGAGRHRTTREAEVRVLEEVNDGDSYAGVDVSSPSESHLGVGQRRVKRRKRLISEDEANRDSKSSKLDENESQEVALPSEESKTEVEDPEPKPKRGRGRPRKSGSVKSDSLHSSDSELPMEEQLSDGTSRGEAGRGRAPKKQEESFHESGLKRQRSYGSESNASDTNIEDRDQDTNRRTKRQIKPKRCYSPSDSK